MLDGNVARRRRLAISMSRNEGPSFIERMRGEHVAITGKVKFFNETRGFGFFTKDDGTGDVFVHRSELPLDIKLLYEGQAVSFDIEKTTRGLRAVNIRLI
jgi:cold shock protein